MADTGRLFVLRPEDRQQGWPVAKNCAAAIREAMDRLHPQGKAVDVRIAPHRAKRALAQNRLLWKWMTEIAAWHADATGQQFQPDAWKLWFQKTILGYTSIELPGGEIEHRIIGTSDLSIQEFTDFLNRIEAWAADQPNLYLFRGDYYHEAMGVAA